MIFSIITPTFNSANYLNELLKSVKLQKFTSIEHVFIDNKSTDATIKIIKNYKKRAKYPVKIFSKKDKGIYYAFNKGINNSRGKIITILNSDDFFPKKNILKEVYNFFLKSDCDFLYGNIQIVNRNNIKKKVRSWKSSYINNEDFYKVPHPSFFITKKFLKNNNLKFNTKFKIASDLDFIIKCFSYSKSYFYLNKDIVFQRSGGTSQKFLNIFKSNVEVYNILRLHKLKRKIFFLFKKIIFKLCQF